MNAPAKLPPRRQPPTSSDPYGWLVDQGPTAVTAGHGRERTKPAAPGGGGVGPQVDQVWVGQARLHPRNGCRKLGDVRDLMRRLSSGLHSDERGAMITLAAAVLVPALLVMIGLVVDGGGKVAASRDADAAAYSAVRYGGEAASVDTAIGNAPTVVAAQAARSYLTQAGVRGTVTVHAGKITVSTTASYNTIFLAMIGINQLTAHGEATALVGRVR